jgi:hypothetical protein
LFVSEQKLWLSQMSSLQCRIAFAIDVSTTSICSHRHLGSSPNERRTLSRGIDSVAYFGKSYLSLGLRQVGDCHHHLIHSRKTSSAVEIAVRVVHDDGSCYWILLKIQRDSKRMFARQMHIFFYTVHI